MFGRMALHCLDRHTGFAVKTYSNTQMVYEAYENLVGEAFWVSDSLEFALVWNSVKQFSLRHVLWLLFGFLVSARPSLLEGGEIAGTKPATAKQHSLPDKALRVLP